MVVGLREGRARSSGKQGGKCGSLDKGETYEAHRCSLPLPFLVLEALDRTRYMGLNSTRRVRIGELL